MNAGVATLCYWIVSPVLRFLHASGVCVGLLALPGFERLRWRIGRLGAWVRFQSARRRVPAYREFLLRNDTAGGGARNSFAAAPATDKENYVKAFPLERRCLGGRLPKTGVLFDESSGSSGLPTNWVRGQQERAANRRALRLGVRHTFGSEPLFILNAFALGPWATGINITFALTASCRMKALGPDLAKIENTLAQFGPDHHYLIMGYPPFLKNLVDRAKVDWNSYRVSMAFGGEGMGESMRRYLQAKGIRKIYGSYGASDLDVNLAAETDFTIALRRLLESRPALAKQVLRQSGALPMIFQYNPADFFIETTPDAELLVTVCRPGCLTPKVRYNIHDLGHVLRFPELVAILAKEGVRVSDLDAKALDLPVLFHYGRSDLSAAYFGCKIPPADVQETLFRLPELARVVDSFQLRTFEDDDGDKRLSLALEVPPDALAASPEQWAETLFDTLATINQDFRESRQMVPAGKRPSLEFHAPGTGPFSGADVRAKRNYVRRDGPPAAASRPNR